MLAETFMPRLEAAARVVKFEAAADRPNGRRFIIATWHRAYSVAARSDVPMLMPSHQRSRSRKRVRGSRTRAEGARRERI